MTVTETSVASVWPTRSPWVIWPVVFAGNAEPSFTVTAAGTDRNIMRFSLPLDPLLDFLDQINHRRKFGIVNLMEIQKSGSFTSCAGHLQSPLKSMRQQAAQGSPVVGAPRHRERPTTLGSLIIETRLLRRPGTLHMRQCNAISTAQIRRMFPICFLAQNS